MNPWSSPFPNCSICRKQADDGGWLDNKDYRFWVCIDCDDWLDEIERGKTLNGKKQQIYKKIQLDKDFFDDSVITDILETYEKTIGQKIFAVGFPEGKHEPDKLRIIIVFENKTILDGFFTVEPVDGNIGIRTQGNWI